MFLIGSLLKVNENVSITEISPYIYITLSKVRSLRSGGDRAVIFHALAIICYPIVHARSRALIDKTILSCDWLVLVGCASQQSNKYQSVSETTNEFSSETATVRLTANNSLLFSGVSLYLSQYTIFLSTRTLLACILAGT